MSVPLSVQRSWARRRRSGCSGGERRWPTRESNVAAHPDRKALALSVLIFVAFVAAVIVRRRRLDADPFRHSRHEGYPPHLKPGW